MSIQCILWIDFGPDVRNILFDVPSIKFYQLCIPDKVKKNLTCALFFWKTGWIYTIWDCGIPNWNHVIRIIF